MTQREQTLNKHAHISDEELRDAIHDAMEEHAIEFYKWYDENYLELYESNKENAPPEQLYNEFNLRT